MKAAMPVLRRLVELFTEPVEPRGRKGEVDPASGAYRLTGREEFAMMGVVLLVDGTLMGLTWLIGWHWFVDYGRGTLVPPTLAAFGTFYVWRSRVAKRNRHPSGDGLDADS